MLAQSKHPEIGRWPEFGGDDIADPGEMEIRKAPGGELTPITNPAKEPVSCRRSHQDGAQKGGICGRLDLREDRE